VRWKLLRRRLSVSAPRMIVRSALPWPLRMLVGAVLLGFSAALALWAYEFGRDIAGLDRDIEAEVLRLRSEVATLRTELEQARQVSNAAEGLLLAERAAQEALAQQVRTLEGEAQGLRDDLGFFEQLLPAAGTARLQVRGLRAEVLAPGQLRFQMLVMQNLRSTVEFKGHYELRLIGQREGRPWTWTPPEPSPPLAVRQYVRVQGMVDHPPDAVIETVQVRVLDERGTTLATQTVSP
jgi:hypothetical protein